VIHSSYKSLLVAFAICTMAAGCALAPESENTQESSSDLTIERGAVQPRIQPTTVNTVAPAQQNAVIQPTAPRALGLDGPKPNPWDDNGGNTNTGTSGGTGTSQNSK
jgi:hypothetical protein